ncbi:hypothetical protein [Streptomyces sp. NBC_01242]|uniref:hypothetical protein n=1 Tax=Streptomyces sp. NBC_01242 TaxID=2903795 RepID=UPI002257FFFA|nr:hypothetical protein [Streptomyces sp. NBC_01242]
MDHLTIRVESSASRLSYALAARLAEYLWLIAPDARSISVSLNQTTGRYEVAEVRDADGRALYRLGEEGVLNSLAPEDAVDRNGAVIDDDANALGVALSIAPLPGRSGASKEYQYGWDVDLPLNTRYLEFPTE